MTALLNKKANKEEQAAKAESKPVASKENTGDAYKILVKPLISEKAYRIMAQGQYVFKVNPGANKISIRNAVEKVYDVKVAKVNIVKMRGKTRNFGKTRGTTSDWKKAIVTLKKGETIAQAS